MAESLQDGMAFIKPATSRSSDFVLFGNAGQLTRQSIQVLR
jgi:hypothetical protein